MAREVHCPSSGRVDHYPAQREIVRELPTGVVSVRVRNRRRNHFFWFEEVNSERRAPEPPANGLGFDDFAEHELPTVVYINGRDYFRRTVVICGVTGGGGRFQISEKREGVGEEGAGTVGERRDNSTETWRGGGGPRGVADMSPELFLARERVELGRRARGGG